ncbi:MAG: hypothetical protein RI909_784, partial [Bacteroidota bacterium]
MRLKLTSLIIPALLLMGSVANG